MSKIWILTSSELNHAEVYVNTVDEAALSTEFVAANGVNGGVSDMHEVG